MASLVSQEPVQPRKMLDSLKTLRSEYPAISMEFIGKQLSSNHSERLDLIACRDLFYCIHRRSHLGVTFLIIGLFI